MSISGNTLRDAFDVFILFRQAEGLSVRTLDWYNYVMKALMHSPIGIPPRTLMREIENTELYRHVAGLSLGKHGGKPLQSSSVNGHVRALRAFFNWAWKEKYTDEKLLDNLRPPRPDYKEVVVLTDAEIARILILVKNEPRSLAIITVMLDTGLRLKEMVEASLDNLDLNSGYLKVMGKGRKERIVLIGLQTRKHLVRYLRSVSDSRKRGNDRILVSRTGRPLTNNGLSLFFARLKIRTGIPRLHAHLLRHTFATRYLLGGGNALALKQLLGHSSFKMTDNYVHIAAADAARHSGGLSIMDRIASGEPLENHMAPAQSKAPFVTWSGSDAYDDRD